jgi:hypothetical protein
LVKGSLLTHLVNEVHFYHGCGQPSSEFEISNLQDFGNIVLIYLILRAKGISLGAGFSEDSLHFDGFVFGLGLRFFGRFYSFERDLHDTA